MNKEVYEKVPGGDLGDVSGHVIAEALGLPQEVIEKPVLSQQPGTGVSFVEVNPRQSLPKAAEVYSGPRHDCPDPA